MELILLQYQYDQANKKKPLDNGWRNPTFNSNILFKKNRPIVFASVK